MRFILVIGIVLAIPVTGFAQPLLALSVSDKLDYQIRQSVGPLALVGEAAYAGILQGLDTPSGMGTGRVRLR